MQVKLLVGTTGAMICRPVCHGAVSLKVGSGLLGYSALTRSREWPKAAGHHETQLEASLAAGGPRWGGRWGPLPGRGPGSRVGVAPPPLEGPTLAALSDAGLLTASAPSLRPTGTFEVPAYFNLMVPLPVAGHVQCWPASTGTGRVTRLPCHSASIVTALFPLLTSGATGALRAAVGTSSNLRSRPGRRGPLPAWGKGHANFVHQPVPMGVRSAAADYARAFPS
jgi:hypothetical protein